MAGGRTPQSQLDSLPLYSAAQFVGGVTTQPTFNIRTANGVFKKWTPADLGINEELPRDDGTGSAYFSTPFLDVTGCNHFQFLLVVHAFAAGSDTGATWNLFAQFRDQVSGYSPSNAISTYGSETQNIVSFSQPVKGAPYPVFFACKGGWYSNNPGSGGGIVTPAGVVGTDVRFAMKHGGAVGATGGAKYTLTLWGSS